MLLHDLPLFCTSRPLFALPLFLGPVPIDRFDLPSPGLRVLAQATVMVTIGGDVPIKDLKGTR